MSDVSTAYRNKKKEVSLMGLFGRESLELLQKKYAEATDFSFSITDFKGEEITNSLILNHYCDKKKQTGSCESCRMSGAFAAAKAAFTNNPYLFECEQGLVEAAIPIIVNNQYLGAVICGRVRCNDKKNLPDTVANQEVNSDHKEEDPKLMELYEEIPEFSYKKIKAIASLVSDYFKEKSEKESYAIMVADYEHKEIHLKDLRKKNASLTRHSKLNDMKSLRASILPEVLINMLVTISNYAILEDAQETETLVEGLSSILRYYIEQNQDRILLSQEIAMVEEYMNILSKRYSNRLKARIQHKSESERQTIPRASILPLVEYIVHFGILSNNNRGTFYLDTTYSIDRCVITLQYEHKENDMESMGYLNQSGHIIDESFISDQMNNIKKRLEYEYNGDYSLKVQKDMIVLDIPRTSESDEVRN